MKVVDIFCGAGGFSEGFRQAGFDIILGIDKWEPAVLTHRSNHPEAKTLLADVVRISLLPDLEFEEIIPDSEIIIGSPPCVSFSNSNRSGKADKNEGIALLKAFFRIVARKKWKKNSKLKYWIMENVPNSLKYIEENYSAKDLGLKGLNNLRVKNGTSDIINAVFYGVPSRRKRIFCGEFPIPAKTVHNEKSIIHLRQVLESLGDPKQRINCLISDPNYSFNLLGEKVTDHHYVQKLARFQWKTAKRLKQDKGYMGKLAFPEDLDRPARTVMATMTFGARESMILGNGKGSFRAPTIREVASLMSFPIDYDFYGRSIGIKYRLVGNAVPPKMSFAFAKAILEKEGYSVPIKYIPINRIDNGEFINLNGKIIPMRSEKRKHAKSRFKYHLPYLKINAFRVELTNFQSDFANNRFSWNTEIHRGQGQSAKVYIPKINIELFQNEEQKQIIKCISFLKNSAVSFNEFQNIYCMTNNERKKMGLVGPFELLDVVNDFIRGLSIEPNHPIIISLNQEQIKLPREIAIGFFILNSNCNEMGRLSS